MFRQLLSASNLEHIHIFSALHPIQIQILVAKSYFSVTLTTSWSQFQTLNLTFCFRWKNDGYDCEFSSGHFTVYRVVRCNLKNVEWCTFA